MVRMVASAVCDGPAAAEDELDAFDMGPGQVFSTAFHPDMSIVAASYQDGTVLTPVNTNCPPSLSRAHAFVHSVCARCI